MILEYFRGHILNQNTKKMKMQSTLFLNNQNQMKRTFEYEILIKWQCF